MKIIDFEAITNLGITPDMCYEWVCETISNKKTMLLPPKISMSDKPGMFCNVMPCIINENWSGVKIVNRYPERVPSLDSRLFLIDNATGEFLAIMDANWITAMRTGAVAAHSIYHLAKKDFETIGIIGLGNTCRATLLVLASLYKDRKFNIKLYRYKGQETNLIERFKDYPNFEFTIVDTEEEVVRGSDVIVSCVTFLDHDICSDDCFSKGVLVVPVHTRGFSNCDLFFDKVFADDYGHVHHFKNFDKFRKFAEVSDVINGTVPGRENDDERILAYNIGIAAHDINYASHIYNLLKDREDIPDYDMKNPSDKFWI